MSKKSSGFLVGAFIGGAAAAAAALLLTPKSGKKMREDLMDQLDEVSEGKASELAGIAQSKSNDLNDLAKQKREEYSWLEDKVTGHVDYAKMTSNEFLEGLKGRTANVQEDFKRTSHEVRGKVNDLAQDDIVLNEEDITDDLYTAIENTDK